MAEKKKYALIGTGGRSYMYSEALLGDFSEHGELAAICDINQARLDYANSQLTDKYGCSPIPAYHIDEFDTMIKERKIDRVIVTTMDRTHHRYIIRAMQAGCDAITEKPMTVDVQKCRAIFKEIDRSGKNLAVTFNYRYAPRASKVKELLMQNVIGRVLSVHFEWLLDTRHGADYFHRWHRDKRNSGGLMVHKATHHFDLVNWWLDTVPELVYAIGDLTFYGRANAEERGMTKFYDRGTGHPNAASDPFALNLEKDENLKSMYLDAESHDGYRRDQSVFGDGISIEDDMAVMVKYRSGAVMTYHLTAYSPWEGFRIAFNGSQGRLEFEVQEKSYVSGSEKDSNRPDIRDAKDFTVEEPVRIVVRPHWDKPMTVPVEESGEGGHGGGDVRLLKDIFIGAENDPLKRAADQWAGAASILTGIAANASMAQKRPIAVDELFTLPEASE
jgi:predicted dehydrogenase